MDEKLREHLKKGFGLQQVLQAVEDQLIEIASKTSPSRPGMATSTGSSQPIKLGDTPCGRLSR